jgi:long-chain acyl-CoA synthetase
MFPGDHFEAQPDKPAVIMGRSGQTVSYRDLEERSNRLAHLLRAE